MFLLQTATDNLTFDLLLTLALFSILAWYARRGLLAAREMSWLGGTLLFFGVSLVFNTVLRRNLQFYAHQNAKLIGMSALEVLPLILALGYGLFAVYRQLAEKLLFSLNLDGMHLRLIQGNLATLKPKPSPDAILLPTAPTLRMTGGVGGALRVFCGPLPEQEALAHAPLPNGQAAATSAGKLPVPHIIHAPLAATGKRSAEDGARRALDAALRCAKAQSARRVVLPPFGIDPGKMPPSASAALTVAAVVRAQRDFEEITVAVFDRRQLAAFRLEFAALAQKYPAATTPIGSAQTHPAP